jgi:hypothetical protein
VRWMIVAKVYFSIAWLAWLLGTLLWWMHGGLVWTERKARMAAIDAKMRAPGVARP